jgi:hypothetical protein
MINEKPYRPSSGIEGMRFFDRFCDRCEHNKVESNPCEIWMDTWEYEIDDPKYPREWITKNGAPHCKKFEEVRNDK